jgi:hypothetical protein
MHRRARRTTDVLLTLVGSLRLSIFKISVTAFCSFSFL